MGKWWSGLTGGKKGLLYNIIKEKYGSVDGSWIEWIHEGNQMGYLWWRNIYRLDHIDHANWDGFQGDSNLK